MSSLRTSCSIFIMTSTVITCRTFIYKFGPSGKYYEESTTFHVKLKEEDKTNVSQRRARKVCLAIEQMGMEKMAIYKNGHGKFGCTKVAMEQMATEKMAMYKIVHDKFGHGKNGHGRNGHVQV